MAFRFSHEDVEVLASIAEHRVLAIRHLLVLHQRNPQALRRRLACFGRHGWVGIWSPSHSGKRGRPELLISLRESGVELLKREGVLAKDIPALRVTGESLRCLDHHLLVNDFRVQLMQMKRIVPGLDARFLAPTSPLLHRSADDRPVVYEWIELEAGSCDAREFAPDGVFCLAHAGLGKTLLFFLEVDMGTETLASPSRAPQDVRQKLVKYQAYFRGGRYHRYEQTWGCSLRGFRVLFVADSATRMAGICRLVEAMPPSDFVWVTDRAALLASGAWSAIWARGGRLGKPLESILGRLVPNPSPAPAPA